MKNFVEKGEVIPYTVPSGGTLSGAGVLIGALVGVAMTTGVQNDVISVALCGVYTLPKATGAISKGAKVYWDDTAKNITTTASGNTAAGYAWAAELSGATTVNVLLAN